MCCIKKYVLIHNKKGENMDLFIVFIRTAFFYFFVFFIYRLLGKREVGQLGIIDLIVSILIAELVAISIEDTDISIFYSIIPILTLTFLEMILANLSLKKPVVRKFIDGSPSVIIKNGKVNYKEMINQKYNLDDLLSQIREKGYRNIEEIEYAILENNGCLSIFEYAGKKSPFPMPIILDGKVQVDALKHLNKDASWVNVILKRRNIELKDVFYAFYKDKNVFIIKNSDLL